MIAIANNVFIGSETEPTEFVAASGWGTTYNMTRKLKNNTFDEAAYKSYDRNLIKHLINIENKMQGSRAVHIPPFFSILIYGRN